MYLEYRSLLPVVRELERRGWLNKGWVTRKGRPRGGRPFTKPRLYELLRNVVYVGKVRYKHEVHTGEHAAVVDPVLFQKVQALLTENGSAGAQAARHSSGALLQGLLHCRPCGSFMTPAQAAKDGGKRYRYYVCTGAQRRGWQSCPSKSLTAAEIERFVLEQLRKLAQDPEAWQAALGPMLEANRVRLAEREEEACRLKQEVANLGAQCRKASPAQRVEMQVPLAQSKERLATMRRQIAALQGQICETEPAHVLVALDPEVAATPEQARIVRALVQRVDYDGASETLTMVLRQVKAAPGTDPSATQAFTFRRRGQESCGQQDMNTEPALPGRVPRLARLLALAHRFTALLQQGEVGDYATLARLGHVSHARVSQIMCLLQLAPEIQEEILFLERPERGKDPWHLRRLLPIAAHLDWAKQRRLWRKLRAAETAGRRADATWQIPARGIAHQKRDKLAPDCLEHARPAR